MQRRKSSHRATARVPRDAQRASHRRGQSSWTLTGKEKGAPQASKSLCKHKERKVQGLSEEGVVVNMDFLELLVQVGGEWKGAVTCSGPSPPPAWWVERSSEA